MDGSSSPQEPTAFPSQYVSDQRLGRDVRVPRVWNHDGFSVKHLGQSTKSLIDARFRLAIIPDVLATIVAVARLKISLSPGGVWARFGKSLNLLCLLKSPFLLR